VRARARARARAYNKKIYLKGYKIFLYIYFYVRIKYINTNIFILIEEQ